MQGSNCLEFVFHSGCAIGMLRSRQLLISGIPVRRQLFSILQGPTGDGAAYDQVFFLEATGFDLFVVILGNLFFNEQQLVSEHLP